MGKIDSDITEVGFITQNDECGLYVATFITRNDETSAGWEMRLVA